MVEANWRVGFLIVEDEQKGKRKAEYGKAVLRDLARRLTAEYGSGYDERNLRYMRSFYLAFPIRNALRSSLQASRGVSRPVRPGNMIKNCPESKLSVQFPLIFPGVL